jgi:superfamily II DNA or RNA helicase
MEIIKRSGLLIPREYNNQEFYVKIKEFLERRSKSYNTSNFVVNVFYIESEKFLLVPRNFPIQQFTFDNEIKDARHPGTQIEINHHIAPRSEAQKKAINFLMSHECGILQLAPGVGKTVITIYMIAERRLKSLILVHRDSLVDQWKERFLDFTDLHKTEIARLNSETFEEDLKKPIIIATTQTFLSLLKRKRQDFLIALNAANIGVFVADEIHTTVGAPTFAECSIHMPSKYTYGLSATPYRYDGNGDIIEFHLGQIFTDADVSGTMDAKVTVLLLDYEIDSPSRYRYIRWGGMFQRARYLNLMKKSKPFMDVIKGLLVKLSQNKNLLCMAERIKLIDELYNWLPFESKARFYASEKLDKLDYRVTFATPGKCRDGIDAPWKDCVVMTSPISNIEQLTGRVIRSREGKETPSIVDMVDYGCREIASTFSTRLKFYEKKGWPIQYYLLKNGMPHPVDKETTFNIIRGK